MALLLNLRHEEVTTEYGDQALSPVLHGRIPAVLVPLMCVVQETISPVVGTVGSKTLASIQLEKRLRSAVVCGLVLAKLESEVVSNSHDPPEVRCCC